jgi:adenosylcobinamide-GDP ribazoletransferase
LSLAIAGGASSLAGATIWPVALGLSIAMGLTLLVTWWARRAIGGQTGDIAGACQQLAEIGFYIGILVATSGPRG